MRLQAEFNFLYYQAGRYFENSALFKAWEICQGWKWKSKHNTGYFLVKTLVNTKSATCFSKSNGMANMFTY